MLARLLLLAATAAGYQLGVSRARPPTMQYEVQAPMVKVFGETKPYEFVTLQPRYTVNDWAAVKPIMEAYLAGPRKDFSCLYCGWTIDGDRLFGRAAHVDGDALVSHIQSVGPFLDTLVSSGVATLEEISVHGPAAELSKCKSAIEGAGSEAPASPPPPPPPPADPPPTLFGISLPSFGGPESPPPPSPTGKGPNAATSAVLRELTQYYEIDSGVSFITKEVGGIPMGQRFCSLQRSYTVSDWTKAKVAMDAIVEKVSEEQNCIYFGWTRCGDQLYCRDSYSAAKGVVKHLENVRDCMEELVAPGVATLDRIELHGPMGQLALCKESFKAFGLGGERPKTQFDDPSIVEEANAPRVKAAEKVEYFNIDSGFQRYEAVRLGGFEQ